MTIIDQDVRSERSPGDAVPVYRRAKFTDDRYSIDRARTIVFLGSIMCLGVLVLPPVVRWVMLPLAFTLPGHALVVAIFGQQLEFGGFRRVGLSAAMTLVVYPLFALTALVAGARWTETTVVVSTMLLIGGCAAVIARRKVRAQRGVPRIEPRSEAYEVTIPGRDLVVPALAIGLSVLITWASVSVLPRKPLDEFSSIALDGTWALTARAVPVDPERTTVVQFRVTNETTSELSYVVTAGIVDGPDWTGATETLAPGATWIGEAEGQALAGSCRSKLEIDMHVVDDQTNHYPLAVYFRDQTISC